MATYPTHTKRWTRAEYDRLIELGVFRTEDRIELISGELIVADPIPDPAAPFGWRYAHREIVGPSGRIASLAAPAAPAAVADLLP